MRKLLLLLALLIWSVSVFAQNPPPRNPLQAQNNLVTWRPIEGAYFVIPVSRATWESVSGPREFAINTV